MHDSKHVYALKKQRKRKISALKGGGSAKKKQFKYTLSSTCYY